MLKIPTLNLLSLLLAVAGSASLVQADSPQPNIIFILTDDLGWSELGCYGNKFNETPNVDRLAAQGIRFTQAYAAAPVCSPYRASFLTGQYPARHGILDYLRPNSVRPLSTDHITVAEMLKKAGYATGMIGKWHLTGYRYHDAEVELRATAHGFDEEIASEIKGVGNGANFWPYVFRKQSVRWLNIKESRFGENEYLVDRMNAEAVDFIERNKNQPFFLYLSHYATHTILNGRPDLVEHFRKKHPPGKSTRTRCYLCQDAGHAGDSLNHWAGNHNPHLAAMLKSIDDGVGSITAKLDELGLSDNTLIVFTSDNGGETNVTSNAPLRGGKSQLYEGGIRVPLVARWPKHIPAASTCEHLTTNVDFYPTLLEAANVKPDEKQQLDGETILASLSSPDAPVSDRTIYWHYPLDQPHFLGGVSAGAIREGEWKLIASYETGQTQLYNLARDPGERNDLADRRPEKAVYLGSKLRAWRRRFGGTAKLDPLLTTPTRVRFQDDFAKNEASDRWFFNEYFTVEDEALVRNDLLGENKRIFIQKPAFGDTMISVDFCFRGTDELRIMTGTPGHYNAVVLVWPNGFRVTTARDESVPFFPTIHGECAIDLQSNTWHTLLIEIHGDEIIARVDDSEHFVVGQHPILDRQRSYFAFQVKGRSAAFDNIRIHDVEPSAHPVWAATRDKLLAVQADRPWLPREPKDRYQDLKTIRHDHLYRTDAKFRELGRQIDLQKIEEREAFADVFRTTKESQKKIAVRRKELLANDTSFKQLHDKINRAKRAEVDYLHRLHEGLADLAPQAYKAALERARQTAKDNAEFQSLIAARRQFEAEQRRGYPDLFRTDADFAADRKAARQRLKDDPTFKAQLRATADAVNAEREYLYNAEPELRRLHAILWPK